MGGALVPAPFRPNCPFAFVFKDEQSSDPKGNDWRERLARHTKIALRAAIRSFRNEKKPIEFRLTETSETVPGDKTWLLILFYVPASVP